MGHFDGILLRQLLVRSNAMYMFWGSLFIYIKRPFSFSILSLLAEWFHPMAKVSHLPMRRYPTDQPAAVNVDPINFYPPANAAHHRVSEMGMPIAKSTGN